MIGAGRAWIMKSLAMPTTPANSPAVRNATIPHAASRRKLNHIRLLIACHACFPSSVTVKRPLDREQSPPDGPFASRSCPTIMKRGDGHVSLAAADKRLAGIERLKPGQSSAAHPLCESNHEGIVRPPVLGHAGVGRLS